MVLLKPIVSHSFFTSHGYERPVRTMICSWMFYIIMPAAAFTWYATKRIPVTIGAALAGPLLAIYQGASGILTYRARFGDAPLPKTPSHGVVVVHPDKSKESNKDNNQSSGENERVPLPSLGRESTENVSKYEKFLHESEKEVPLRILVIGDSLAIGVGQAKSATPVLPEAIAKTLSKQLRGRPVYWTCHGAPGASTAWIVHELESGVLHLSERESGGMSQEEALLGPGSSDSDETSSLCSSDGAEDAVHVVTESGVVSAWREKLTQHRKRLGHPERLGPYDIVVVMTGSNDLKGACFPFLLTGKDAEFRRQAKERGGSYSKELRRLFETVNTRMQERIQKIVLNLEEATESVIERVEETMEYIAPGSSHRLPSPRSSKRLRSRSTEGFFLGSKRSDEEVKKPPRHMPLIVLPGMPARSLPVFRGFPLRWLSVPAVDIMDMHKRNFSKGLPGEVLFVPAPSVEDLAKYRNEIGEVWEQRVSEETVLVLRDIRAKDAQRTEKAMKEYYEGRPCVCPYITDDAAGLFSVDGVHPIEEGYDFWGRYLATHISKDMLATKKHL